jgi:hypothetical protein
VDLRQYELPGDTTQKKSKKETAVGNSGNAIQTETLCNNEAVLSNSKEHINDDAANGYISVECDAASSNERANIEFLPDRNEMNDMMKYSNESRSSLLIPDEQAVMLSFMWSAPHCRRLFQAFPEVLYIDGTHATNRERMPLLTVGIRDHEFKMNVVVRAFIPNERAWLFRWIFFHGIPTLMGKESCQKVKLIITDGDSQETTQIDNAIKANVYGGAMRRRCGWHIIEKGSTVHLRSSIKGKKFQEIVSIMKIWVQESLMKDVETEDEYSR